MLINGILLGHIKQDVMVNNKSYNLVLLNKINCKNKLTFRTNSADD